MPDNSPPTSWLCPTPGDRSRMLDMERRLAPVRSATFVILALALVSFGPELGWWPLAALFFAIVSWVVVGRGLDRARYPEYRLALGWCMGQVTIAASVALSGGP